MAWYKMICFYDEFFFGGLLILLGVIIILKAIFKINLPLWPIVGGIGLMYLGLSLIVENIQKTYCKKTTYSNKTKADDL